jgi:hypothetical protein
MRYAEPTQILWPAGFIVLRLEFVGSVQDPNNGVFSVQSAYNIQFEGRIATYFHLILYGTPMLRANVNFTFGLLFWEDVLPLIIWRSVRYLTTQFFF